MIRQGNIKEKIQKTVKLQFAQKFCVYLLPMKKVIARITKNTWKDAIENKIDDILMERDPITKSNEFARQKSMYKQFKIADHPIMVMRLHPQAQDYLTPHEYVLLCQILIFISVNNFRILDF